jgi:hypothetical protein
LFSNVKRQIGAHCAKPDKADFGVSHGPFSLPQRDAAMRLGLSCKRSILPYLACPSTVYRDL